MIKVKYVGKKPFTLDNVAKSGAVWNGPGSIAEVTPRQAKILTGYPDQWALAVPADVTKMNVTEYVVTEDNRGKKTKTKVAELEGRVERMTAAQLVAYAKLTYGKDLKANRPRKIMLDEVVAMAATTDRL